MAIVSEEHDINAQLDDLGVKLDALTRAVAAAAGGYNQTTRFHPSSGPGTYLYQEATAGIRRELDGHEDWSFDEDDHQPRTFSLDHQVAIVVQSGDENTGIDGELQPKTRNPKGRATAAKVESNFRQLSLFDPLSASIVAPQNGDLLTWILLIAVVDGVVQSELSLPREWSSDGRPCGWLVRVLLPEQDLGGVAPIELTSGNEAEPVDIDIAWK